MLCLISVGGITVSVSTLLDSRAQLIANPSCERHAAPIFSLRVRRFD
jgi:hypothetical protein